MGKKRSDTTVNQDRKKKDEGMYTLFADICKQELCSYSWTSSFMSPMRVLKLCPRATVQGGEFKCRVWEAVRSSKVIKFKEVTEMWTSVPL